MRGLYMAPRSSRGWLGTHPVPPPIVVSRLFRVRREIEPLELAAYVASTKTAANFLVLVPAHAGSGNDDGWHATVAFFFLIRQRRFLAQGSHSRVTNLTGSNFGNCVNGGKKSESLPLLATLGHHLRRIQWGVFRTGALTICPLGKTG